jgi:isoleucyl-tRNA synthetase
MTPTDDPRLFAPLHETIGASPSAAENDVLVRWRERITFESVQKAREGGERFVFWEGPPTANGKPGIHHVFARTIKDAVCRYQTMSGKRVVRKAGWDTHGLPVEIEVEKKFGIKSKQEIEKDIAGFNAKCRESVWTYRKDWEQLSERIAYWLDYAHPYVTYEPDYVESVWAILAKFHQAGFVYRGKKVVPFCGRCGTGLSSHELGQPGVYRDIMDPSVYVRFVVGEKDGERTSFLAWTTTPWTLPSNIALAVHPDLEYVTARVPLPVAKGAEKGSAGYERLIVAKARAKALFGDDFEVLEMRFGRDFAGHRSASGEGGVGDRYQPLFDAAVPRVEPGGWKSEDAFLHSVLQADYVSADDGTGVVHQAAAYGVDDWATAARYRLPVKQAVGPEGKYLADVGAVKAGTFFKDADDALMEDLKQRGLLFKKAREAHSYPHCWRCDTALFYFATPAWYVRTSAHKQRMVELNRRIRWIPPEVGAGRFGEWLENNIDWNISRDRYWGTPLPYWICDRDDAHERALGSVEEMRKLAGSWPDGFDNHRPSIDAVKFPCDRAGCGGTMVRTKAVLDAWFDSGAMPYAQYHWPFEGSREVLADQFPADFIAEGLDQTRGWFYTLHAIGTLLTEIEGTGLPKGPIYKTCVVNGLVLDKDGVKMSKRLGNVVDPWKAIEEHGADAVRWYLLASGSPWLPKRFDPNLLLEERKRFFGTLQNSYKFFADYARLPDGFDPARDKAPSVRERPEIDRWLASRTQTSIRDVRAKMEAYDLSGACASLEEFVVDELSNWYIRRNRARFWKGTGADKVSAFATLHAALETVALLLAPIAPFLSEMLFERLSPGKGSVHAQRLPEIDAKLVDADLEGSMRVVVKVVEMGRALRERANLKIRTPLRAIHVRSSDERSLDLLRRPFAADQVLGELNIKTFGSLAADDGQLCRLRAKANFRVLGKRIGALMKPAAAAIEALDPASIARLRSGERLVLDAGAEKVEIGPEDVEVKVETQATFDVETDGRLVVYLDTQLDDELIAEGLLREIVTGINGLRKRDGLTVSDRVRLRLVTGDPVLGKMLSTFAQRIGEETLAVECTHEVVTLLPQPWDLFPPTPEFEHEHTLDLGEGRQLRVSYTRL